jgi:hypothetical protein
VCGGRVVKGWGMEVCERARDEERNSKCDNA